MDDRQVQLSVNEKRQRILKVGITDAASEVFALSANLFYSQI